MEENKKGRGLGKGLSELLGEARAKAAFSRQEVKQEDKGFKQSQNLTAPSKKKFSDDFQDLNKELEDLDKEFIETNNVNHTNLVQNDDFSAFDMPKRDNFQEETSFVDNNYAHEDDDEFEIVTSPIDKTNEYHLGNQSEEVILQRKNLHAEINNDIATQNLIEEHSEVFEKIPFTDDNFDKEINSKHISITEEKLKIDTEKQDTDEEGQSISIGKFQKVPIELIVPNKEQPRKFFDINSLNDLAASITMYGVIQPIIVNKSSDEYIIVAGERRWRASQLAGLKEMPVIIANYAQAETLEIALIENIQRANLSPLEEAKAYYHLIQKYEFTQNEVAQKVGKSRSHIANMVRLLELNDTIKEYLERGDITIGHARVLVGLNNASELAERIVKSNLSVRKIEELVAMQGTSMKSAILPKATKAGKDVDILALEADLKAALGVGVTINVQSKQKGHMVIRYESLEQLDEICKRLCSTTGDDFA